jgi:peptidoglycan glycosyltransferase
VTLWNPLEVLEALVDAGAWPVLRAGLHVAFFLSVLTVLMRISDLRSRTQLRHLTRPKKSFPVPVIAVTVLFALVLLHQATWQLTGVFRPDFIAFMQSHDRREFNPAHRIQRGRILDHRGSVLAYSREHEGRVLRVYPYGPAFAHVVGYTHPKFGAAGIEAAATGHLDGGVSASLAAWGELGRQLLTRDKRRRGQDLVLTLDTDLQLTAIRLLRNHRGAAVMLRPDDGAIRVLATIPSYDPNRITPGLFQGTDPRAPLLNRATQGLYPPGSSFKIVTAALALNRGFKGTLYCPADGFTTSAHYRKIRDHDYYAARRKGTPWRGHGDLDLATALSVSSNVFFAQLGVSYGHQAFLHNADRFHFNRSVKVHDGPHGDWTMTTGRLPRLHPSDRYGLAQASIGQGEVLVTPAHMALIAAAVANRGVAPKPRLVESDPPQPLARFMPAATAAALTGMLRKAVTEGTARAIELPGLAIAGKTGTAENPQGAAHSWFVGFAPTERPAMAIAVLVEHGGYGSRTAAPIARDLLARAQELGLLP